MPPPQRQKRVMNTRSGHWPRRAKKAAKIAGTVGSPPHARFAISALSHISGPLVQSGMERAFGAQQGYLPTASEHHVEFNMIHMQGRDGLIDALPEKRERAPITA